VAINVGNLLFLPACQVRAERSRYCFSSRPSVCLSVCLSVGLREQKLKKIVKLLIRITDQLGIIYVTVNPKGFLKFNFCTFNRDL